MNQAIERVQPGSSGALAAQVVLDGDLAGLNDAQLSTYYIEMCRSLDLNHLTRPFSLLKLNGKLIWYANKDCSDQLRKRDKVSVAIVSREEVGGVLVVTARASMPDGRTDESIGALSIEKLQGEARANALMKCETKAKRRVTLSICGLGMLDESEIEDAKATEGPPHLSPHSGPGENPHALPRESSEFDKLIAELEQADRELFDPGVEHATLLRWREKLGNKAAGIRTEFGARVSKLYLGDEISPDQKGAISKLTNRVDRKMTALEGRLKPPPVESSFVDDPDEEAVSVFSPSEDPAQDNQ